MLKDILKKVRHLEISANNTIDSLFAGNYKSAFRGRGLEFADIRPYDTSDDVRDIDWKTTSKHGELFVKTYHESRDNSLFFVIDGSAAMHFSSTPQMKYERLLETFSLLAFAALKNGDRIGAMWNDGAETKIFPPKKGKKNLMQILMFCIEQYTIKKPENFSSVNRAKIFQQVFSFLPHSASIFWLTGETPELSAPEKKYLKILRLKHDFIPLVFSDPLEENFTYRGDFMFQDSFSQEISLMTITPEIAENFQKIRGAKKLKFIDFFQKNRTQTLFIAASDQIFKKLYLFFRTRQKIFR